MENRQLGAWSLELVNPLEVTWKEILCCNLGVDVSLACNCNHELFHKNYLELAHLQRVASRRLGNLN